MSSINPPSIPQPSGDRDGQGRFTKGNKGGPGNPYARQVAALRQRLLARLTAQELDAITDALLRLARGGDVAAARLVLQYALGKPAEPRGPDRLDADEGDPQDAPPKPAPVSKREEPAPSMPTTFSPDARPDVPPAMPATSPDSKRSKRPAGAGRTARSPCPPPQAGRHQTEKTASSNGRIPNN